jgi:methylenetetrahydrofolate dehydrogenase (NADP+)/methenyltetrahydrofolate cyclohydrolase
MTLLISGKELANSMKEDLRARIQKSGGTPVLAAVIFGGDEGSLAYAKSKAKSAEKLGIDVEIIHHPEVDSTAEALLKLEDVSTDSHFHGIILEEPLPKGIDPFPLREAIPPEKDVDCTTSANLGRIISGDPLYYPATPMAVIELLKYYKIDTVGKHVVIIGRSRTVGLPLANMLLRKGHGADATVTVCHSRTPNMAELTKQADILVVAMGKAEFVGRDFVSEKTVVIDVGTNYTENGLVGDVDFADVENYVEAITPVPGGVGPVTVAGLLTNVYGAFLRLR